MRLASQDRLREPATSLDPPQITEGKKGQKHTAAERLAIWIAQKFDMQATPDETQDSKCANAPEMTTALILQIFLPGVGFGYMGRWDWFCIELGSIFMPCILVCCAVFLQAKPGNEEAWFPWICGGLSGCFCVAPAVIWFWGIIVIANRSLLCGDNCMLAVSEFECS